MMVEEKFVVFPVGLSHCAVAAACVAELTLPQPVYSFPHATREILGVILRRGKVIPLYDVAGLLHLPESAPAQYHLISFRHVAGTRELAAIPVSGRCDLVSAKAAPAKRTAAGVIGELMQDDRSYELLDLDKLIAAGIAE